MNDHRPWYQLRSDAFKAVNKWVKQGFASSKISREDLFYKYSCVLPSSKRMTWQWKHIVDDELTASILRHHSLNWWQPATRFHVIRIPQDKQSFCHSISVTLWGIPDGKGLVSFLIKTTLKLHSRVWELRFNRNNVHGAKIERLKSDAGTLTPDHVFILANILQRPIIIIVASDDNITTNGMKDHSAESFEGIYLPLMSKPVNCSKTPIFLAYHNACFFPLVMEVPTEESNCALLDKYSVSFPLVKRDFGVLPVKCLQGSDELRAGEILQDYLVVKDIDVVVGDGTLRPLFIHTECLTLPNDKNVILEYMMMSLQSFENKSRNHLKMAMHPLTVFKRLSHTTHNNGTQQGLIHLNRDALDQPVKPGTRSSYVPNPSAVVHTSNESFHLEPNAPAMSLEPIAPTMRLEPNAPMMSLELNTEPISMTHERCVLCKSYRSSIKTFPFCHECYEQRNKVNENQISNGNLSIHPKHGEGSTLLTSVSDQQKQLECYPDASTKNYIVLPAMTNTSLTNAQVNNKSESGEEQHATVTLTTAVDELAVSDYSPTADENFIEVSFQPSFGLQNPMTGVSKMCGSPVCEEKISSSEVLCQRCIHILKVHHLTNCNKHCCNDTVFNAHVDKFNGDVNRDRDVEMRSNDFSMRSTTRPQPNFELESSSKPSIHVVPQRGISRTISEPKPNTPDESVMSPRYEINRTISEPENGRHDLDNIANPFHPKKGSLMVTSLTSIEETNHILDIICGGDDRSLSSGDTNIAIENGTGKQPVYGNSERSSQIFLNKGEDNKGNGKNVRQDFIITARSDELKAKGGDYFQTMEYLESNIKKGAIRCKTYKCSNYGSSQRDGYCSKCFNDMDSDSGQCGHFPGRYGIDQCDGVDPSSEEEDMVDGFVEIRMDAPDTAYHTMQDESSSSDSSDFFTSETELDDV